jgi:hypothetical protein
MRLYQLCFRVGGAFEGALFIEASSVGAALWEAARAGLDPGGECDGIELHPDDARAIPRKFFGRLLDADRGSAPTWRSTSTVSQDHRKSLVKRGTTSG